MYDGGTSKYLKILELEQELEWRRCSDGIDGFKRFLQKYCFIQDKVKKRPSLFKLWPTQLKILNDIFFAMLLFIIKARQLGLTWLCAGYSLWIVIFNPMKLVIVISAKGEWAVEFLDRVYFILRLLPVWILERIDIAKDTSEVFRVNHPGGYSEIKSLTTTESGAQSKTPDVIILDETCWNPYIRGIYGASIPGIIDAGGRVIVISNSIKNAPGWGWTKETIKEALQKLNDFKIIFMAWWDRPGRPKDFRKRMRASGMSEEDVSQHYPESITEALSVVTGSYFGKTLARHEKNLTPGIRGDLVRDIYGEWSFEPNPRGIIEIWRFPYFLTEKWDGIYWTRRYCIGSDVSEGLGQSNSAGYVMDRLTDEMVARIWHNRLDAVQWAKWLYRLSKFYRNGRDHGEHMKSLICVERTGAGLTTVKELQKRKAHQYMKVVPGTASMPVRKELGWSETEQSKHILCGDLKNWFRTTKGGFYCSTLLEECSHTIKHEGSRRIGPEDDTMYWDHVVAAGCTIQASIFMGPPPEAIEKPPTGWLKRWQDEK